MHDGLITSKPFGYTKLFLQNFIDTTDDVAHDWHWCVVDAHFLAHNRIVFLQEVLVEVNCEVLFVIDGGKALRRAIKDVFGEHALVHRCHRHKERNVIDLLPDRDRDQVRGRLRAAWSLTDADLATLEARDYVFDIELISASAIDAICAADSVFTILPEVTTST